jgi:Flp pilus assembly pilin Flp
MKQNRKSGQGMVEYIIIVAVIALAAIAVFGIFGDTIRAKMAGGVKQLDTDKGAEADATLSTTSQQYLKDLK